MWWPQTVLCVDNTYVCTALPVDRQTTPCFGLVQLNAGASSLHRLSKKGGGLGLGGGGEGGYQEGGGAGSGVGGRGAAKKGGGASFSVAHRCESQSVCMVFRCESQSARIARRC